MEVDISRLITVYYMNSYLDASDVMRVLGFEILHQLGDWNLPERNKVIKWYPGRGPRLLTDLKFRFADFRSHNFSLKKTELYSKTDKQKNKGKFSVTTNQSINGRGIASGFTVLQKQSLSELHLELCSCCRRSPLWCLTRTTYEISEKSHKSKAIALPQSSFF